MRRAGNWVQRHPSLWADREIASNSTEGNLRLLDEALRSDEEILCVAEASRNFLRLGLLAATNKRLIYVEERFFRNIHQVAPIEQIREVNINVLPVTSNVDVLFRDGSIWTFTMVRPRDRAERLARQILELLDDPLDAVIDSAD